MFVERPSFRPSFRLPENSLADRRVYRLPMRLFELYSADDATDGQAAFRQMPSVADVSQRGRDFRANIRIWIHF